MSYPTHRPTRHRRQAGFTLIELLVSFVIFSFGLLGLVGLQTKVVSMNQSSLFRSQASALTDDVFDRMRADRANAVASPSGWATDVTADAASMGSPATFTGRELQAWKREVEALLPNGAASITVVAGVVEVRVQWSDDTRGRDGDTQTFRTISQL
ncbi:type IV pilus modification protein PilV [Sphaerotilaceae bacterium SBD11-9]